MLNFRNCNQNKIVSNKVASLTLLAAFALLAGCSSAPVGDRTQVCTAMYNDAEKQFTSQHWSSAQGKLEKILTECHGTGYMERTQFMLAEADFQLEEWIEARGEYTTFVLNFPSAPTAETAAFRKAISAFKMSTLDMRDDSPTQTAVRDFEDFVSNYPSSALIDSATKYQDSLSNRLGEKDFQTAFLYWRMDEPLATALYLKSFIRDYPNNPRQFEAHKLIIDAYLSIEQFDQAQYYIDHMSSLFPQSKDLALSRQGDVSKARAKAETRAKDEQKQNVYRKEDQL